VVILPKRNPKRLTLNPRTVLIKTTAIAKLPERKSAKMESPDSLLFLRNFSIPKAATTDVTTAVNRGGIFKINPMATPSNATWARVSAISEYRRTTKKVPISGAIIAIAVPATKALIIKSY